MANKKTKFLKNLLTTASAFAVIAGGIDSAMATDRTTTNNAVFENGTVAAGGNLNGGGNIAAGDSVTFGVGGHTLTIGANGNPGTVAGVTTDNAGGGIVAAVNLSFLGSVGGANVSGGLTINDNVTLTLTGRPSIALGKVGTNDYSKLGNIVLGSGGGPGTLNVDLANAVGGIKSITLSGTIDSNAAASDGVITIQAGNEVIFNQVIGGTEELGRLELVGAAKATIGNNASFSNGGSADTIKLGAGSELTFSGAITLTGANDKIDGAVAGNGTLKIKAGAGNTVTFAGFLVGGSRAIDSIEIYEGNFKTNKAIKAVNGVILKNKGILDVNGAALELGDAVTVTSILGDGANASGSVLLTNHNLTVNGSIGTDASPIDNIEIANGAANKTITILDVANAANSLVTRNGIKWDTAAAGGANGGVIDIKSKDLTINTDIGTAAKRLTTVKVTSNGGLGAAEGKATLAEGKKIYAVDFELVNGKNNTLVLKKNSEVNVSGAFKMADAGSKLVFEGDEAKVTGNIASEGGANRGLIEIKENGIVTGNIGVDGGNTKVESITFAVADKTFTVGGAIQTNGGIKFDNHGTLNLTKSGALTLTSSIVSAADANGKGEIKANSFGKANTFEITGKIGDATAGGKDRALRRLEAIGGGKVKLTASNSHIKEILIGGQDSVLELANDSYRIEKLEVSSGGTGELLFSKNAAAKLLGKAGEAYSLGSVNRRIDVLNLGADNERIFEDNINIYTNKLQVPNDGNAALIFEGNSVFATTNVGNADAKYNKTLGAIKADGDEGKTLALSGALKLTAAGGNDGKLRIHKATVTVDSNFEAVAIEAKAAGAGKLKFVNRAPILVKSPVAAGLLEVEFAGQNVQFDGNFAHDNNIKFSGNEAITVKFDAATDIGNNTIINSSEGITQTVQISKDTTFTKSIGVDNPVNIDLNGNITATVNPTADEETALAKVAFTTTDGQAKLVMAKQNAKVRSVGTSTMAFAKLEFTNNGEVSNNVYAANIEVQNDKTATFGGIVSGTNLKLLDEDAKAVFKTGSTVQTNIVSTNGNNKGYAIFEGSTIVAKKIGADNARLKSVVFADGNDFVTELRDSVYSENIRFGAGNVNIAASTTLGGQSKFTNSNINLGKNTVQSSGGSFTLTGTPKITASISQNSAKELVGGKIIINNDSTLSYNGVTSLNIVISGSTSPTAANRTFNLLDNNAGTEIAAADKLDLSKLSLKFDSQSLSTWTAGIDDKGGIVLTLENNVVGGITESFKAAGAVISAEDSINLGLISKGTGDAEKLVDALDRMNPGNRADAVKRLSEAGSPEAANDVVEDVISTVSGVLIQRLAPTATVSLGKAMQVTSANNQFSGVSAGDDNSRYGIWASPIVGQVSQKANKGVSGYKSTKVGGSAGFQAKLNDDVDLGLAFTYVDTKVKHKNNKSGDITKISSALFSIYGLQQFTDNWFGQGILTVGSNSIENTEARVISNNVIEKAKGKYSSMSLSGEVMAGYNYVIEQVMFTPMAGARFTRVNDGGYKETGTSFQNLDISKKAANKFELIAGARISSDAIRMDSSDVSIVPELHGFVNYDTIAKSPRVSARLSGVSSPLATKSAKPQKVSYNLGLGVNIRYGMLEYSGTFNSIFSGKSTGQEGAVKVTVHF